MIKSRKDLHEIIKYEKNIYLSKDKYIKILTCDQQYITYKFLKALRKTEYFYNVKNKIMYAIYRRKKNRIGLRLGIEMCENSIGKGAVIYHPNSIVINGYSKIGKDCKFHGNNCIGNNGKSFKSPIIGNNVRFGVGSKVIGDIVLADNITIAAGAVVVDSFLQEGITIAGIPARKIK